MPFFRFTTVLAAALAGGLFLAAAQVRAQAPAPLAAPAPAPAKPYRIGAAVYGLKGEFMQMWTKELKAHPAVKDGMVQITVFDGNYDARRVRAGNPWGRGRPRPACSYRRHQAGCFAWNSPGLQMVDRTWAQRFMPCGANCRAARRRR